MAALGAAMLASCVGGEESADDVVVVGSESLTGVEVSVSTAAALARNDQEVVLVDGLADTAGGRTTRVYLDDGAERRTVEAQGLPLNAVEAWFAEDRLIVVGLNCPRFDREALLAESGGGDIEGICGATSRRIAAVDLDTGEWELLEEHPLESVDDPRLPAAANGRVLMSPHRLWDPDESSIALTGLPDVSQDREVTICSAAEPHAVVRTGGVLSPPTLPLPPEGSAPSPTPPAPPEQEPEVLRLYELVGTEWRESPIDVTDGFAGQAPLGCSAEGMVVGGYDADADRVVARVVTIGTRGQTSLVDLDLPISDGPTVPWVTVDTAGTLLIETGDGHWLAIDGGRRTDLGEVDLMSARQVLVHDGVGLVIPNVLDRPVTVAEV